MAALKPVLHSFFRSSCSWRVRTALALKGIDYEYKTVNVVKGEQLTDAYRSVNPLRQVPALEIDGVILTQSEPEPEVGNKEQALRSRPDIDQDFWILFENSSDALFEKWPKMSARIQYMLKSKQNGRRSSMLKIHIQLPIIEYLEETRPNGSLFPKDPFKRFMTRQVTEIINAGIQPLQNLGLIKFVGEGMHMELGNTFITQGFQALEKTLETTCGKYCVGDEVTVADLFLVPQVYNANRFEVNMTAFPIISRINDTLSELDAFKASHPSKQPDYPEGPSTNVATGPSKFPKSKL